MQMEDKHGGMWPPGEFDMEKRVELTRDFLACEAKVRAKLGSKIALLDKYLWGFLFAISQMDIHQAVEQGFGAGYELSFLIRSLLEGAEEYAAHPFYPGAVEFIQNHPLSAVNSECRAIVYYLAMSDAWLEYSLREEKKQFEEQCRMSGIPRELEDELRGELHALLDDRELQDSLIRCFMERHCAVPLLQAYALGVTGCLNYHVMDAIECEPVSAFRVWLESGIGVMPTLSPAAGERS